MTLLKLRNGNDSTFGSYLAVAQSLQEGDNKAVLWIREKIETMPNGENTEVLVEEPVMMWFLNLLISEAK